MNPKDKHTHGFKTPKDYFESFEDRLFSTLEEDELPKDHGFEIPESYFQDLEDTLMSKVRKEEFSRKPTKVIAMPYRKTIGYIAAMAACLVIGLLIINPSSPKTEPLALADIESYLLDHSTSLNTNDITPWLLEEDIQAMTTEAVIFSEENLEHYLLENIDDTHLFIE